MAAAATGSLHVADSAIIKTYGDEIKRIQGATQMGVLLETKRYG